jgi:phosphoribosyl 1,2-cyclic phosphodiesterase
MEIVFWGVRGTAPVSGKDCVRYGGHTPCASIVSSAGDIVIVDAGTGIKRLGETLMAQAKAGEVRLHILFTHFHLDHVIGLPFFSPLYSDRVGISFYSALAPQETEKCLRVLMGGRYFPVDFRETASSKSFLRFGEKGISVGNLEICACPLVHPQGSVAYRISEGSGSIVFATDTEPPEAGVDERLAAFIQKTTYFVYDATFTPEEYATRQGWGHSTWLEGTKLARRAGVRHLVLSHLNPDHDDKQVGRMVKQAQKEFRRTSAAQEGRRLRIEKSNQEVRQ